MGGILRNKLGGFLFIFFLFFTSLFGSVLMMGPLIPLMFIKPLLFRRLNDNLLALWLTLPILLMELLFGTQCKVTGDRLDKSERSVIIMNHRTRLDWMFFWKPLFAHSSVRSEKIVLKDDLKHIPGSGWAMQMGCYLFLKRKWDSDEKQLRMLLDYYCDMDYCVQYLLFPEGTDYCDYSKLKSDSYAKKNDLQKYDYVLHPRTTGFKFIMDLLRRRNMVDAVYDVTVAYPDVMPLGGELDILRGKMPHEVHFHVRRHPVGEIPPDTDMEAWCAELWREKEAQLQRYYDGDRAFPSRGPGEGGGGWDTVAREYAPLYGALAFWLVLFTFLVSLMLHSSIAWWHMLVTGTVFTAIHLFYGGIERLIVHAYYWHRGCSQRLDG